LGHVDEVTVVIVGVGTQEQERMIHAQTSLFSHYAFGLFYNDTDVQGVPEPVVHDLGLRRRAVLDHGNRCHIGQGLGGEYVGRLELSDVGPKQVDSADGQIAQVHRHGVDRPKACLECSGSELGPSVDGHGEVLVHDRLAGAKTLGTRAFFGLPLEQLQHTHRIAGRGDDPQLSRRRKQHDPGGANIEDVHTPIGEQGQQIYDVKVVNESVS
jgi:hypothetical protein